MFRERWSEVELFLSTYLRAVDVVNSTIGNTLIEVETALFHLAYLAVRNSR